MIESINFRARISASLLRAAQTVIAEIPQQLYGTGSTPTMTSSISYKALPRQVARNRQRWLVDTNLVELDRQIDRTASSEFDPCNWLLSGNPRLANLITSTIGDRWMTHLEDLQQLAPLAKNHLFQARWRAVKRANKQILAESLKRELGIEIDVNTLFDLQAQPIAGHQRQLLNLLYIISAYDRIKQNPEIEFAPRTFIFSGDLEAANEDGDNEDTNRAVLGTISALAKILAADPAVRGKLQIVYVPDAAGLTDKLYAAADITEQIATAAIEDIDLSVLQATINGVISIGSLGKTNYWLEQAVGAENCFRFGLAIPEIALFKEYGYDPYNYYKNYPQIRQAIDALLAGDLTPEAPSLCRAIVNALLGEDDRMVLADYVFYAACQAHISETYDRTSQWTQMSILNVAGVR
jgi:glycogen phosphorylase